LGIERKRLYQRRRASRVAATVIAACAYAAAAPAQPARIDGGFSGVAPITAAPLSPDPTYARVMPPGEFTGMDVPLRRRVMTAWALGSPELAGPAILPMLNAGLADTDREVRTQALRVLDKVERQAFANRGVNKPVLTDASAYGPLFTTLVRMLEDPEPGARSSAVAGLANLDSPPKERLDGPLLNALAKETDAFVKSRIITGLTTRAALGAAAPLAAVLAGLDDQAVEVRFRSVIAMQIVRHPDGLARVAGQLTSTEPALRLAAVRALAAYGEAAAAHRPALEAQLKTETNTDVRNELERLLKLLGPERL
jgi:HEAT repeat protein